VGRRHRHLRQLTPPQAHAGVSLGALRAGKHVYSEKPLATTLADGGALALHVLDVMQGLLASAQAGGRRVVITTSQRMGLAA
jgi:GFO/IDH/MocA oxidoreductase family protein